MSADGSAYALLGIEPGADAAEIARAYKKLIKQFHPDRAGGDATRAAEINRAYRELRLAGRVKEPLDLQQWDEPDAARAQVRTAVILLGLAGAGTLAAAAAFFVGSSPAITTPLRLVQKDSGRTDPDVMEQPIAWAAVNDAVADAKRMSGTSDEMTLASASRECHRRLRAMPSVAQLDRCAAFDDAVVLLQDRDPLRDRGPFSELAVTGRKMSGATLLSNDPLAIDGRLDRIRLRVVLTLAPPVKPEIPAGED